jgi:hypothetical protein
MGVSGESMLLDARAVGVVQVERKKVERRRRRLERKVVGKFPAPPTLHHPRNHEK